MAQQSRLQILIDAKNRTSGELKRVNQDLATLSRQGGMASAALGKVGTALAAAFTVAAVSQIGQAAFELGRLGAEATRLEIAFGGMAASVGQSSHSMLQSLRAASRGMISDSDLVLAANKALMMGVARDTEELTKLLEIAAARGAAMGLSTGQAFDDIVTGLARGSIEILDNLGLVISSQEAYERYADSIGKTVDQLSKSQRTQALVNAVLEQSAGIVGPADNPYERAAVSIDNLRGAVGQFINTATGFPKLLDDIANAADNVTESIQRGIQTEAHNRMWRLGEDLSNLVAEYERQAERMRQAGIGGDVEQLKQASNHMEMLRASIMAVGREYNQAAAITGAPLVDLGLLTQGIMAFEDMERNIADAGNAADTTRGQLREMGLEARLAAQEFDTAMARSRSNLAALQSIAVGMVGHLGAAGTSDWINEQNALLRIYQDYWRNVEEYSDDYVDNVLTPSFLAGLREQSAELNKAEKSTARMAAQVPQISKEFQSLQQAVQGALSGALDPGVGVDPDKLLEEMFGFTPDRINENARRLADIAAHGLKGQDWLGAFASEVPSIWQAIRMASDPQQEAAFLLRDFQAGLRPDLLDKGAAKDLARRLLLGEANMAELAREISEELAREMGVSQFKALDAASRAFGMGGMAGPGTDSMEAFTAGAENAIQSEAMGSRVMEAFTKSMAASYSRLETAGQDAARAYGQAFGDYFSEHVPQRLINVLATLITPEVMAQLHQHGTLTGAES